MSETPNFQPDLTVQSGDGIQATPPPDTPNEEAKDIFEKHSDALMGQYGATCEALGVEYAAAVAVEPHTGRPIIFTRGDTYNNARLVKLLLLQLRNQLMEELSI